MFKSSFIGSLVLLAAALFFSGVSAQVGPVNSISSKVSSKCLQVRNSKFANGTAVEQYDCNTSTSQWQQWSFSPGNTEVRVASPCPGVKFCLDANRLVSANKVTISPCNKAATQQWTFTNNGLLKVANTNFCLDVPASDTTNGVQVIVYGCHGGPNQVWKSV